MTSSTSTTCSASALRAKRMIGRVTMTAVLMALVVAGLASLASAAPSSLYKGSAQRLIPTPTQAGFTQLTSQSGTAKRAAASYAAPAGGGNFPTAIATVAITVFQTEAAAKARYGTACAGCENKNGTFNGWKYKSTFQRNLPASPNSLRLVARCINLMVETTRTGGNRESLTYASKRMIDEGIFAKAVRFGMTRCGGTSKPLPKTGTYYWSESFAETMVVKKVRIPACAAYPDDPNCRYGRPLFVQSANCRGLDEKPGTFTYSRFTCDVLVGAYGRIRGRLGVWPTGPTTFRWTIL